VPHDYAEAGLRAVQGTANLEATQHFVKALALLTMLSSGPEFLQQELEVRPAVGPALVAGKYIASEYARGCCYGY
jgi:hypothetical protein